MFTTAKAVTIQATIEKWDMFETNGRGGGGGGGGGGGVYKIDYHGCWSRFSTLKMLHSSLGADEKYSRKIGRLPSRIG